MTFSEIYKILSFEKTKLITTKLLCPQKNNLTIITSSVKQCGTQIVNLYNKCITLVLIRCNEALLKTKLMVLLPTSSNLLISTYFLLQCFNMPKFRPCGGLNK
jgi:hypothetical protein